MRKKKPVAIKDRYEWLHETLGLYGTSALTTEQFWDRMNVRGYSQGDIDSWLAEYLQRSNNDACTGKEIEDRSA